MKQILSLRSEVGKQPLGTGFPTTLAQSLFLWPVSPAATQARQVTYNIGSRNQRKKKPGIVRDAEKC